MLTSQEAHALNTPRKGYRTITITTTYWRPGHDYLAAISCAVAGKIRPRDVVVLSEKAISVAKGLVADERQIRPGMTAKLISHIWMRLVWGHLLARICHLSELTRKRLCSYPLREGAAHKQLALNYAGFLHALRHGSEDGIDVSNLPYSYASLPLREPGRIAGDILESLHRSGVKDISVLIVDSDKTYSWRGLHFSPRSSTIRGIRSLGVLAYLLGRSLRLRARSTPIAQAGYPLEAEEALRIAALANRARGSGSGKSAWDMAERFGTGLTEVTWEMLNSVEHRPIVIVRRNLHWN